ncbi:hypothetical protein DENSPDRAFT_283455 [Dentipellis sp. KUC8613]|nr:hypothetical protein DENSPDRAFT_283455 [Dentipellis sp. KUC8613]
MLFSSSSPFPPPCLLHPPLLCSSQQSRRVVCSSSPPIPLRSSSTRFHPHSGFSAASGFRFPGFGFQSSSHLSSPFAFLRLALCARLAVDTSHPRPRPHSHRTNAFTPSPFHLPPPPASLVIVHTSFILILIRRIRILFNTHRSPSLSRFIVLSPLSD